MDKEIPTIPKVEAGADDIPITSEPSPNQPPPYQSPTIDEADASFFQGDRQLEVAQEEQQPEPPTPPQRASRPDVAAEDLQLGTQGDDQIQQLQLAAQMSQALREVVATSSTVVESSYVSHQEHSLASLQQQLEDEEEDEEMHDQDHDISEAHGLPSLTDTQPSIQQDIQHTLQQVIQNEEAHRHEQAQPQQQQQQTPHPSSTSISHPRPPLPSSQSSQTQFNPSPHRPILAPANSVGGAQPQYALEDATPPRKRSKVSRACDECRRKKVKCDAASENGDETCSNCRRSNVRCMFSRVPQKRGPSKGYIKELADRINSIEGKLGGQSVAEALVGDSLVRRSQGEAYVASTPGDDIRKRTFSHISTNNLSTPSPNRPTAWQSEQRPAFSQTPSYSANGLALKPLLPRETSIHTPNRPISLDGAHAGSQLGQHPPAVLHPQPHHPIPPLPATTAIGEHVYHTYLNVVHHVLPFLPGSKEFLDVQLAQCSSTLQNAFVGAFLPTMASFSTAPTPQGSVAAASRLLADYECESGKRSQAHDLVHLQCLILMIINIDNFGPVSLTGDHEGPAKATLIGRAAGLAYSMALPHEAMTIINVDDGETEQYVRVRAWWTLVILDRWNAISTATPLVISGDAVVLPHNLKPILGEANYRFTLLAYIMGHWTPASVVAPVNLTPGAAAQASATFHLNMEMWRAHFPGDIPPNVEPVLHLSYWHCRLLAFLFMPSCLITDVTWAVRESVQLLTSHPHMFSPLNHHFTSLTTLCLIEMSKSSKSRQEATQLLANLLDANIAPSAWDTAIRERIRAALNSSASPSPEATNTSQGLQHLADLATATTGGSASSTANNAPPAPPSALDAPTTLATDEEPKFRTSDNYEDLGFDPRPLLCEGYLKAIPQIPS